MKTILTIRDKDFRLDFPDPPVYKERGAARAVVFDNEKKIALLHVMKLRYHKLPGGGIEKGESMEDALRREVSEEIGCSIGNVRELGIVEEFRNKSSLHQLSYCFLADLAGEKGVPHLEQGEIDDGFETVWLSIKDAIKILESEAGVEDYEGKFIQKRDLAFLEQASRLKV
jgi:ADP-ribose pyrophosphatase YjhB (NUDIX family)